MGTVTAIRVREHRVRQKLGRACFEIECDEIALITRSSATDFCLAKGPRKVLIA